MIKYDIIGDYEPPKENSLSNSDIIIPKYYQDHSNLSKILEFDYYNIIKG